MVGTAAKSASKVTDYSNSFSKLEKRDLRQDLLNIVTHQERSNSDKLRFSDLY
jgi:hypothetical protein